MARTRQRMFVEQSAIRASLGKLRMSGAAFALPQEVVRSLESVIGGGGQVRGRHLVSMRTTQGSNSSR